MIKKLNLSTFQELIKKSIPLMIIIIKEKFFNITIILFILIYPQHDDDKHNVFKIKSQYSSDKNKINLKLKPDYIKTCLFLINKCDEKKVDDDNDENKQIKEIKRNMINNLYKYISENEEKL